MFISKYAREKGLRVVVTLMSILQADQLLKFHYKHSALKNIFGSKKITVFFSSMFLLHDLQGKKCKKDWEYLILKHSFPHDDDKDRTGWLHVIWAHSHTFPVYYYIYTKVPCRSVLFTIPFFPYQFLFLFEKEMLPLTMPMCISKENVFILW